MIGTDPDRLEAPMTALPDSADRELLVSWDDPSVTAGQVGRTSGLEFLEAVRDGLLPAPPIARLLGFDLTLVEDGRAQFTLDPGEQHYNPIGSVHGGVYATLLDSAAGCCVHSTLPAGVGYTSLDLQVKFLRPMTTATGPVVAEGRVVHRGSRTMLAEVTLTDGRGRLLATATSSCLVIPLA